MAWKEWCDVNCQVPKGNCGNCRTTCRMLLPRVEGDRLPEGRRIKSAWPQKAICAEPIRSGHYCQRVKFKPYSAVSSSKPGFLRFGSADCAISSRKSCRGQQRCPHKNHPARAIPPADCGEGRTAPWHVAICLSVRGRWPPPPQPVAAMADVRRLELFVARIFQENPCGAVDPFHSSTALERAFSCLRPAFLWP